MTITITFKELIDLISLKTKQNIGLEYVSADTFKVTKEVKVPFIKITKKIGVNVTVVGFSGHDLILKDPYDLVSKLLSLLDGLDIKSLATISNSKIAVHLDSIQQVAKVMKHVEPKSLHFISDGVILEAVLLS